MTGDQGRRRAWKLTGWSVGSAALILAAVLVLRTLAFDSRRPTVEWVTDVSIDAEAAAERLARALRFETVSHQDRGQIDAEPFRALHAYLEEAFPQVHGSLQQETVAGLSLLYRWPGQDTALDPVVLMAHQDVVPVEAESAAEWTFAPFAGELVDGFVRGRGALDDKAGLVGLLEAAELLLREGFAPQRTIYLAFGHDEEIGGWQGARSIAELLAARRVRPAVVLDEGGMIADGLLPGVEAPVALIGIAEKGAANFELVARVPGGHSSVQQESTAIGVLSRAIARIENQPFRARLEAPTRAMFLSIGPELPFWQRLVGANLWLLEPLVARMMASGPSGATVRTTVAPTLIRAGVKPNVLPTEARALVNVRTLTGETADDVLERFREVVDDERVEIKYSGRWVDPSPVSRIDTPGYRWIERSILEAAHEQNLVVAPFLVIGGTDSKHFAELSDQVYRFLGAKITPRDLTRVHGIDERISVGDYARVVRIYRQLLINTGALSHL